MSLPQGRRDDFVVFPSGRQLHGLAAIEILEPEKDVWQFQIVQDAPAHLRVDVVAANACDRPALRERLQAKFSATMGEELAVDLAFRDTIERTPEGKHRTFRSRLNIQR